MQMTLSGKRLRLLFSIDRLAGTLWFIPSLMAVGSVLLALGSLILDNYWQPDDQNWMTFLLRANAAGAQSMLSTIAGSMITVAGVIFSITVVVLTLASSQFGPRLLRGFITDNVNQAVLGTFIATFLYCLVILKAAYKNGDGSFVPHLSLMLSLILAMMSIAMLIVFIHRITLSIQASSIIGRVIAEFENTIDRITTEDAPHTHQSYQHTLSTAHPARTHIITSKKNGYLTRIDTEAISQHAEQCTGPIEVLERIGTYVCRGMPIFLIHTHDLKPEEQEKLLTSVGFSDQRKPIQDLEYNILQLVEIAVRSLSPGINDPFTALACIDRMSGPLRHLAGRHFPPQHHYNDTGRILVTSQLVTWDDITKASFDQIRQNADGKSVVLIGMFAAIARIAGGALDEHRLDDLAQHAVLIHVQASVSLPESTDRLSACKAYDQALFFIAVRRRELQKDTTNGVPLAEFDWRDKPPNRT